MAISSVISLLLIVQNECSLNVHRSQWPRSLRRGSATARLLGLRFGLIICPEESYRVWCVRV